MKFATCCSFVVGILISFGGSLVYFDAEFVKGNTFIAHSLITRLYLTGIALMLIGIGSKLFFNEQNK